MNCLIYYMSAMCGIVSCVFTIVQFYLNCWLWIFMSKLILSNWNLEKGILNQFKLMYTYLKFWLTKFTSWPTQYTLYTTFIFPIATNESYCVTMHRTANLRGCPGSQLTPLYIKWALSICNSRLNFKYMFFSLWEIALDYFEWYSVFLQV